MKYSDAGVNIDLGDDVSRILYNAARQTWKNREGKLGEVIELFPDFSGLRAVHIGGLPLGTYMNMSFDGVGTKVELGERTEKHDTIAYDLFAMVCDDAVVRGAEPVLVGSILDVNSLGNDGESYIEQVKQLAKGYIDAAREAGVAVVNGEVAELGARVKGYGNFNYNWGAGVVWFANRDRMFTGREIKEGDSLVGLLEDGFRSNGISLLRKIMRKVHGDGWHNIMWKRGNVTLGQMALTPSRIYTRAVIDMFGGYSGEPKAEIHGIAHITGGGLPGKLARVLKPSGLGAVINNPMKPSEFMLYTQALGNVSDEEAYKTWNMGQGMVIITPEPEKVQRIAGEYRITSQVIGEIVQTPRITIYNKGALSPKRNPNLTDESHFKKGPEELVFT